jgi:hypothetical protein
MLIGRFKGLMIGQEKGFRLTDDYLDVVNQHIDRAGAQTFPRHV